MRKFMLALCAIFVSVAAFGQQTSGTGNPNNLSPIPDCVAFKSYVDLTNGAVYASKGSPCAWVQSGGASGGASTSGTAVTVSKVCSASDSNCFQVFDDVQTAMGATYTTSIVGGVTQTSITTNSNPSFQEYGTTGAAGSYISSATSNVSQSFGFLSAAFKTTGSPTAGSCWGTDQSASASTTIVASASPVGGSGHLLVAVANGALATPITITFSDASGSGQTWRYATGSVLVNGNDDARMGYVENVAGGTYNVTATFSSSSQYRGIHVCEYTIGTTSGTLDTSSTSNSTGTIAGLILTTSAANDLTVSDFVPSAGSTITVGNLGGTVAVATDSSDPVFASTDIGKKITASTNCDTVNGYINCHSSFLVGTIATFVDSHHVTVSAIPLLDSLTQGTNFTGWFLWGHDDGAQIAAAWTKALALPNVVLSLPCGTMFIGVPPFLSTSGGGVYNPNISGCGVGNGTVLVPTGDFSYGSASGGLIYSYPNTNLSGRGGAFQFQNPYIRDFISNITIWGAGVDGGSVISTLPIMNLNTTELTNVWLVGWNWNHAGATMDAFYGPGFILNGGGAWSAGSSNIHYTGDSQFGSEGSASNCQVGVMGTFSGGAITNPTNGLIIDGGHLVTKNCQIYPPSGVAADTTVAASITAGIWDSFGDSIGGLVATGGQANLNGSSTTNLNHFGVTVSNSAATVRTKNSQIDKLTISAGSFVDQGDNQACSTVQSTSYLPCSTFVYVPWTANPSGNSITGGSIVGNAGSFKYSVAGTALPSCATAWNGYGAIVSDATGPTYNGTYSGSGAVLSPVLCDGTNWKTH